VLDRAIKSRSVSVSVTSHHGIRIMLSAERETIPEPDSAPGKFGVDQGVLCNHQPFSFRASPQGGQGMQAFGNPCACAGYISFALVASHPAHTGRSFEVAPEPTFHEIRQHVEEPMGEDHLALKARKRDGIDASVPCPALAEGGDAGAELVAGSLVVRLCAFIDGDAFLLVAAELTLLDVVFRHKPVRGFERRHGLGLGAAVFDRLGEERLDFGEEWFAFFVGCHGLSR
jgi:hypothetical protein